jgi:hypothetical protein
METRLVWITLLAGMGEDGVSRFGSVENLAVRAGVSREAVNDAILKLADQKRPFLQGAGRGVGWRILDHDQFLNPMRWSAKQEENRNRMAAYRAAVAEAELPFASPRFEDAWLLWEQARKEKKAPITPTARKLQLAKLKKMGEARAIAALVHSTESGYTGIFEPKGFSTGNPATQAELDQLERDMGKRGVHYGVFREALKGILFAKPGLTLVQLRAHFDHKYPEPI